MTLMDNTLNGQIIGPGAYMSWNNWVYLDTSVYQPISRDTNEVIGPVPVAGRNSFIGVVPFWQVAIEHLFAHNTQYFQIGTFGTNAQLYPGGDRSTGFNDHLLDLGLEANYQYLAIPHYPISAHATFIQEHQNLKATYALGNSSFPTEVINEFRTDVTYSINDTIVPTVQYFQTRGSNDPALWGTANGSPNTQGYTVDLAYVPFGKPDSPWNTFANLRIALQYTGYTQYGGTSAHASDNNTIFLNLWIIMAPLVPLHAN